MKLRPSKVAPEALTVLAQMQVRDYPHLDKQVRGAQDEIIRDLSFGRLALSIPEDHYEVLTIAYPELQSNDATEKTLAWKAFMEMEVSRPYKPNKKMRSM